jgi:uncharacterized RDD family membrane protein YckC
MPAGIVTGEAVVLELRPASFLTRALALALDAVVLVVLGIGLVLLVTTATAGLDTAAQTAAALATVVLVVVVVPTTWEAASRGRSPGKAAAGLRVVRDDGGPVRVRHAVVRALVAVGELWLLSGCPAIIASLASAQGKRIGDLLAGTVVVRERSGAARRVPLAMPPELAAWARGADIGRVPDALATSARAVLDRGASLHPGSRARLLTELTAAVAPLVAPAPPVGTPPERFLAAVLVERRERDRVRLSRARQRRDVLAEESRRLTGL